MTIGHWLLAPALLAQPVPPLINYQGRLANADGSPFPTADYTLNVTIHDAATGGSLVWGPQQFDGGTAAGHGPRLPVIQGYFNVMLGPVDVQGRSILDAFGASNRFVQVMVDNGAPILPRQRIVTTPFASIAGNGVPPGTVEAYAGNAEAAPPPGWLLCDGRALRKSDYPNLWNAIGIRWGDGSTGVNGEPIANHDFNLPDLRGYFLRGRSAGSFADPDADSRGANRRGGVSGNLVGTVQGDQLKSHAHTTARRYVNVVEDGAGPWSGGGQPGGTGIANSVNATGGAETRPKNAYVDFMIKY